jgi:hypothetical protein
MKASPLILSHPDGDVPRPIWLLAARCHGTMFAAYAPERQLCGPLALNMRY